MIKKILKIRGVGLFHDAIPMAIKFSKITLIYGENGRGKTTLSTIFSSLANDNPSLLSARKTIRGTNNQEIEILMDGPLYKFNNKIWDRTFENITIFDSAFVDANVYSGFNISSNQRESLLEFTLGKTGGQFKQNVDALTEKISKISSEIRENGNIIARIGYPFPIDAYVAIQQDSKIDEKISQQEKLLESVKDVDEICKKPTLSEIHFEIPDCDILKNLLSVSISTIAADAKQRVFEHINENMKTSNEQWIKDGLTLIKSPNCPFCGERITESNHLIELYQKYFDKSYREHQYELQAFQRIQLEKISDTHLSTFEHANNLNKSIYESNWKQLIKTKFGEISFSEKSVEIRRIRQKIQGLITTKISNPVSSIKIDSEFDSEIKFINEIRAQIKIYNDQVRTINTEILETKRQLQKTDLQTVQRNFDQLLMVKERFESKNKELCDKYELLKKEKELCENEKEEARNALIEYSNDLLGRMETGINQYLSQFNAGFRISNVDTSHERGFPRIKYQLQLRDQNIELGSSDDAQKKPVFSNTLSEGDKRTLAFSFFLAKNNLDPKINEKIIVVDDPMSSLDQSRQFTTQMALKELSEKGKQLIVLSHDPRFLQSFLENGFFHSEDFVTLELTRSSNDYTIMKECNLDDCIQTGYKKNYRTVSDYVLQGQCRDKVLVVRSIRPMVEATLRYRYLDSLKGAESLGKMIGIIEQSQSDSPLFRARSILPKLKEINVYTAGHTHDTSADDSLQQITDSELTRYSKIALELAQGV
jgi:wobble nucleotide-excising tRNase